MMGGEMNWSALEYLIESFGVEDVEIFVTHILAIRNHLESKASVR